MKYIEVVGLDGAGKSRLCRSLAYKLRDRARIIGVSQAKVTRKAVRLVSRCEDVSPLARLLTYMSAQSESYDKIASDLDSVSYLIGDRGHACLHVYQHCVGSQVIDDLWDVAMRGFFPDLLVFIDTPIAVCQERLARRRNLSLIDQKPACFHASVRERYLAFIDTYSRGRTLIVDGAKEWYSQRQYVLKNSRKLPAVIYSMVLPALVN